MTHIYKYVIAILGLTTPTTILLFGGLSYYSDYFRGFFQNDESFDVYDFIVVGSGSAGAVVAARLAKFNKVLLLEAGGTPSPLNSIPGIAIDLIGYPATDWRHETVPQKKSCLAMENQVSRWPRGKILGGSTGLNWMMYLRGHPYDYDNWANITQDEEWNYENLVPLFKKSVKKYVGKYPENKKHNGDSDYGFLNIDYHKWDTLYDEFVQTGKENGFSEVDFNGPQKSGFGPVHVTQKKGERWGTYAALLRDNTNPNLKISQYSQATKIKLDKGNRAVGVHYIRHGVKKFARATKEIIISGGAIDSPKLLMLSGIGPEKHLKSIGVKPRINLPVGQNLQDHTFTLLIPFLIDSPISFLPDRDLSPGVFLEYFTKGTGALTVPNAVNGQGFFSTSNVKKTGRDWPNVQFLFGPCGMFESIGPSFDRGLTLKPGFLGEFINPHMGNDSFLLATIMTRPDSVGEITLKSNNPLDYPLIDPKYFDDPRDVDAATEAVEYLVKMFEGSKAFKKHGVKYPNNPLPGCKSHKFRSKAYWECYLRHLTLTTWHPIGTCRMGKGKQDKKAVVDSKLRVLNAKGLRVIDASIMPVIVNANTNAPTIVIGERGSDFIRRYWAEQFLVCDKMDRLCGRDANKCYYARFA